MSTKHWHSHTLPTTCMQTARNLADPAAFIYLIAAGLTADAALQVPEAQGLPPCIETLSISLGVELSSLVSEAGLTACAALQVPETHGLPPSIQGRPQASGTDGVALQPDPTAVAPEDQPECTICHEGFERPCRTPCQHWFCK